MSRSPHIHTHVSPSFSEDEVSLVHYIRCVFPRDQDPYHKTCGMDPGRDYREVFVTKPPAIVLAWVVCALTDWSEWQETQWRPSEAREMMIEKWDSEQRNEQVERKDPCCIRYYPQHSRLYPLTVSLIMEVVNVWVSWCPCLSSHGFGSWATFFHFFNYPSLAFVSFVFPVPPFYYLLPSLRDTLDLGRSPLILFHSFLLTVMFLDVKFSKEDVMYTPSFESSFRIRYVVFLGKVLYCLCTLLWVL